MRIKILDKPRSMAAGAVVLAALALTSLSAAPAAAQARQDTLADIRQELSVLFVEVQRLKQELNTTGSPQLNISGGVLERADAIEAQLQRLTQDTEELGNRLNRIVSDGTNRLGDLEFRLCELETSCDVANLGDTPTLGGGDLPGALSVPVPAPNAAPLTSGVELAVGEKRDFELAEKALKDGKYAKAAELLDGFSASYPGSPLAGEAQFLRGQANAGIDQWKKAARAYLESFSGAPDGPVAPQALFGLGTALGKLGQKDEACITLTEVGSRFPGDPAEGDARRAMQSLGCS